MIKPLEQYDTKHRMLLALALVMGIVLLELGIAKLGDGAEAQGTADELYADVASDPKLLELDKRALDEAYEAQVRHLWDIWLRGQARGTKEISTGLRMARSSYAVAAGQIAKREQGK